MHHHRTHRAIRPCGTGHDACKHTLGAVRGETMLHDIYVVMFAMATGFTLSGIISNLYQLMFPKTEGGLAKTAHIGVMVFAGPSVLFQSSYKAMREQRGSRGAFWLASAVSAYWSMVLGLIFLRVAFSI